MGAPSAGGIRQALFRNRELNNSLTECRKLAIELETALRIIDNMATGTEGEILGPAEG